LENFLLFLILYLFYNTSLLKIYNNIKLRISFIKFVNNINILIYRKLTKCNCKVLDKIYSKYKKNIYIYNTKFLKVKYKLIYFSKISK